MTRRVSIMPEIHHHSPVVGLRTTDYGLRTSVVRRRWSDYGLRTSVVRRRSSAIELRTTDYGLRTSVVPSSSSPVSARREPVDVILGYSQAGSGQPRDARDGFDGLACRHELAQLPLDVARQADRLCLLIVRLERDDRRPNEVEGLFQ